MTVELIGVLDNKPHYKASLKGKRMPSKQEIAQWVEEALIGIDPTKLEITINFKNE